MPTLETPPARTRNIHVVLAGNPNAGKTSVYNNLTGSRQKVANYPGVTVETTEGRVERDGVRYRIVDLPGIYSLTANSPEERIARNHVLDHRPDVIVQVMDAASIERSLYLTVQLRELGVRLVIDLNMSDETEARGIRIDDRLLAERLDAEVVRTVGNRNLGTEELLAAIERAADRPRVTRRCRFDAELQRLIDKLTYRLGEGNDREGRYPAEWTAIKVLEGDREIRQRLEQEPGGSAILDRVLREISELTRRGGESPESLIANARYADVETIRRDVVRLEPGATHDTLSERIDAVLLHKWIGMPVFLLIMYLMFQFTFTLAQPFMDAIEAGFAMLGTGVGAVLAPGPLQSLLVDGVIAGVGGVVVFLPNILFLFFFIGLLEKTGYMARAAFLTDRLMARIGLHGRSFIPMLSGFGCSIPAIMATRTLEHERDRLATMMAIPLMSCSARLTIYALLIPAFFPVEYRGLALFSMYAIGVALAVGLIKLLRMTLLKGETTPLVMELPPYRKPTLRSILVDMWNKSRMYLRKAGTVILAISIVLWFLASYPKKTDFEIDRAPAAARMAPAELEAARNSEALAWSIAGRIGHGMENLFRPLGFDWKICTGLIGALAAKEVFVAQMGIVYALADDAESDEGAGTLRRILSSTYPPLTGFCIMLFCLVSFPCISTFAIMRRESNSWKWPILQSAGYTVLAYVLTLIVYQAGVALGIGTGTS